MGSLKMTVDEALQKAYGRNPLLEVLGPFIDVAAMPSILSNNPLDRLPWQDVIISHRIDFLSLMQSHFVPTPEAVGIAIAMQQMIRASYIERHPGLPCNRQQRRAIAQLDPEKLRTAPWFPKFARGMVIKGMTGLGKSLMKDRVLELYPQVFRHGKYVEGGWEEHLQLVYLNVSMSGDTSRLGFLDNILLAIDTALGTDYYSMYGGPRSRMSTEKLMVIIGKILSQLHCGILVIDEIQARNFRDNRELVLLFFLRLLNFGIPVLLIGNPNGFVGFEESAQDTRRLYKIDDFELWPAASGTEKPWKIYVEGKLQFALLPLDFPVDNTALVEFYRCSGGVHDYFDTLWSTMQERSLRKGLSSIQFDDIGRAYASRKMNKLRRTIDGLVEHDINKLAVTTDIPLVQFAKRWNVPLSPGLRAAPDAQLASRSDTKRASSRKATGSPKTSLKPRVRRTKQADAMFRSRQERAAADQEAATEPAIPTKEAARAKANRASLVDQAEKLAKMTSATPSDSRATRK